MMEDLRGTGEAVMEPFAYRIGRYRGVILLVIVPLPLISFVLYLMPTSSHGSVVAVLDSDRKIISKGGSKSYAVIFDAGGFMSRVYVYCFDVNLDLVTIGKEVELFVQAVIFNLEAPMQTEIQFT